MAEPTRQRNPPGSTSGAGRRSHASNGSRSAARALIGGILGPGRPMRAGLVRERRARRTHAEGEPSRAALGVLGGRSCHAGRRPSPAPPPAFAVSAPWATPRGPWTSARPPSPSGRATGTADPPPWTGQDHLDRAGRGIHRRADVAAEFGPLGPALSTPTSRQRTAQLNGAERGRPPSPHHDDDGDGVLRMEEDTHSDRAPRTRPSGRCRASSRSGLPRRRTPAWGPTSPPGPAGAPLPSDCPPTASPGEWTRT
jgi:hypothetical protein